jgi:hypothetical protein
MNNFRGFNMNCIQGDLAIIVKGNLSDEGRIVTCLRFLGNKIPGFKLDPINMDIWLLSTTVRANLNNQVIHLPFIPDSHLRPLRYSTEVDETLLYAGLPKRFPLHMSHLIVELERLGIGLKK